jgi:hypothetical protein
MVRIGVDFTGAIAHDIVTDLTRASDLFPGGDTDNQVKAAKEWLSSKGVREFEPVSLFSEQLEKVGFVFRASVR